MISVEMDKETMEAVEEGARILGALKESIAEVDKKINVLAPALMSSQMLLLQHQAMIEELELRVKELETVKVNSGGSRGK